MSLLLAVFGLLVLAPGAAASCVDGVVWSGTFYAGMSARAAVPVGQALSGGVVPGCDDVIVIGPDGRRVNPKPPDTPVRLNRVRGVSAALAVTRPDMRRTLYLAPGTFPQLASHPLHERIYGDRPAARRRSCSGRRTIRVRVADTPAAGANIRVRTPGGNFTFVEVQRGTKLRGARKVAGQPSLREGDRLTVTGVRCGGTGFDSALVAERIRVRRRR